MQHLHCSHPGNRMRSVRAFTITELLIAIVILVGVLLAAGRIFNTTAEVAGLGEANNDVLQEVAAIEEQIRADFRALSRQGPFAIRNVAMRNNARGPGLPLIDPTREPDAIIRSDQIVFFTNEVTLSATGYASDRGSSRRSGNVSRVYYGHGTQVRQGGEPVTFSSGGSPSAYCHGAEREIVPWEFGTFPSRQYDYTPPPSIGGNDVFTGINPNTGLLDPIESRDWNFVRQPVVLVDDEPSGWPRNLNQQALYMVISGEPEFEGAMLTSKSIFLQHPDPVLGFSPEIMHGRIDGSSDTPDKIRRALEFEAPDFDIPRLWAGNVAAGGSDIDGRELAEELIYYPRAEVYPPSMHRYDQALANTIIGNGVSDVRIEWTWREGTGELLNPDGSIFAAGFTRYAEFQQTTPWFGMDMATSFGDASLEDGVRPVGLNVNGNGDTTWDWPTTVIADPAGSDPTTIERWGPYRGDASLDDIVEQYTAIFGYNETDALDDTGFPNHELGFTPWPNAIRITLVLHDSKGKLSQGRTVQFVIDLPDPPRGIEESS